MKKITNIMKRLAGGMILAIFICGCGLSTTYLRSQSDYQKVANIALYGGTKAYVLKVFGEPDSKEAFEDGSEQWVYNNREDGRTIKFVFDSKGKVQQTSI